MINITFDILKVQIPTTKFKEKVEMRIRLVQNRTKCRTHFTTSRLIFQPALILVSIVVEVIVSDLALECRHRRVVFVHALGIAVQADGDSVSCDVVEQSGLLCLLLATEVTRRD